jgi:hypothetical protein
VFGIDGFEGVFTVVPLLFWAAVVAALAWVVRRAVRQGRTRVDAHQPGPAEPETVRPSSPTTWRR